MPSMDRPRFKRKLTPFICRELMYDYVSHRLPSIRHKDVEEYIEDHEDLRAECELYESSLEYLSRLEKIEVSEELVDQLKSSQSIANHVVQASRLRNWPDWLLLLVQILGTSTLVVLSVVYINWFELNDWIEDNLSFVSVVIDEEPEEAFNPADEVSEIVANDESTIESNIVAGSDPNVASEIPQNNLAENEPDTPIAVIGEEETEATQINEVEPKATSSPVAEVEPTPAPKTPRLKGMVTKIFMGLPNIDQNTKEIVAWLNERGGSKAGDVPLGWRRPKGSYFNIRINKEYLDPLVDFLKTKSKVTVDTVPHRIVMGEGEVRVILWIRALQSAKKQMVITNEKQPETVKPPGAQPNGAPGNLETKQKTDPISTQSPSTEAAPSTDQNKPSTPEEEQDPSDEADPEDPGQANGEA